MKRFSKLIVGLSILMVFSGCASTKGAKPAASQENDSQAAAQSDKVQDGKKTESLQSGEEPQQQKQDEEVLMPEMKKFLSPKPLPHKVERVPIDPKRVVHVEGNVTLNAESMPLSDFVVYALGETLKITFFMDEQVMNMKNPVTLRMTQEMPAEKVVEMVVAFLEKNNLDLDEKGGALYILKPKPQAAQPPAVDYRIGRKVEDSPAGLVQFVPLKYLRTQEVFQLLLDLFKDVQIRLFPKENCFMFSGSASAIKEAVDFIDLIDVPTFREKRIFLSRLTYWQPEDFIRQITTILEGVGFSVAKGAGDLGITFIPIKYINSVLIVSPDDSMLKFTMDWKRRLDNADAAGAEEKAFTFSPQYSRASDLVDSIKKLYGIMPATVTGPAKGGQTTPPATPGGAPPPAASLGSASAAVPLPTTAAVSPVTSTTALPGLKISADDKRNIIVIISTPSIYKSLLAILRELDKPPKQVLIEATIAELTLTDDLTYGLEWYIKNRMQDGTYSLSTLGQLGLSTASGVAYKFLSDSQRFQAAVSAFAQQNKINILSTPRIMVLDNSSATITVGTQVPLLSGSTTSTSASTEVTVATQAVSYATTGIILTVTPTINTEGLLTLNISLEDSQAQTNNTSSINSPLILTRSLNTSVVATSSQTLLLGGMMSDSVSDTETKIPLVGDIPLIGNLFKTRSKAKTKTELIIMLTPRILTNSDQASKITDEVKKGIKWLE
ncbi:MAG: type II secretion system protein GspD [Nitrospirae bacterium]|nr:type II secretion system protein GspD [Nitrospirota bacterium]